MRLLRRLPLYALLLVLTQCSKCKNDPTPTKPEDQLPAATQTGANTFGCLLNGQVWLPSGSIGTNDSFRVTYDPTYANGSLQIRVFKVIPNYLDPQYFFISGATMNKIGTYPIDYQICGVAYYTEKRDACQEYSRSSSLGTTVRGQLTITRLDMRAGIISGTFDFTLAQTGCDTLKITQGRFDKKL